MNGERKTNNCIRLLDPKKNADKQWFLSLLDEEKQRIYEDERLKATLILLRAYKINPLKKKTAAAEEELAVLRARQSKNAETYCRIKELGAETIRLAEEIEKCRPFFNEPYFARMASTSEGESPVGMSLKRCIASILSFFVFLQCMKRRRGFMQGGGG